MSYLYHLQKHKPKIKCPNCGRNRCFVPYVDANEAVVDAEKYGRCERINSCGYNEYPKGIKNENKDYKPKPPKPPKPPVYYSMELVRQCFKPYNNQLVQFLMMATENNMMAEIDKAVTDYRIGSDKNGGVIFWQIDQYNNVHRGKIMYYGADGHRLKDIDRNGIVTYVRCKLNRSSDIEPDMCYFGLHLLPIYPDKTVCIVESEKTALIGAVIFPQYLWIATGSISTFNPKWCEPLKYRKCQVFPDNDGFDNWVKKTSDIRFALSETDAQGNEVFTMDIAVNPFIKEYGKESEDVADIFLKYRFDIDN